MATNDYHFVTHWRVPGSARDVSDIIGDAPSLPRWWPSVYLDVQEVEPGDDSGVGRVIDLYTKGWLPYRLRWQFRVTEADAPNGFAIEAWGDFVGEGRWTFVEEGGFTDVTYDWRIRADKPLLRRLSWLMKPLFEANHRWAMARGEESLLLELQRRKAASDAVRDLVPEPPGPTRLPLRGIAAAGAGVGVVALAFVGLRRRG